MKPRLNLTFIDEDFAAICAAASIQKMPPQAWAKSRLLMAAEREGFATSDDGERTRPRGKPGAPSRAADAAK